jgi:putative transcriptional regulator
MEVKQMFVYKFNVLESLKEAGYTPGRLRKEKLLGENAIQSLRKNEMIGIIALEKICKLLDMQPGNIIKYVEDTEK